MSYVEYSNELYQAVDRIKDSFWLDDVIDDIETVMWYAGMSKLFKNARPDEWEWLLKQAQEILHIDIGK